MAAILRWDVPHVDRTVIRKIVRRAEAVAAELGVEYPALDISLDVTATHMNGTPLNLLELLAANKGDFIHDVFGIRRHLNRDTGKLENHFLPRHATGDE